MTSTEGLVRPAAGTELDRDNNHLLVVAVEAAVNDGCDTITVDLGETVGMPAVVLDATGAWNRLAEPDAPARPAPEPPIGCVRREDLLTGRATYQEWPRRFRVSAAPGAGFSDSAVRPSAAEVIASVTASRLTPSRPVLVRVSCAPLGSRDGGPAEEGAIIAVEATEAKSV